MIVGIIAEHKVNGNFYWVPTMRYNHMLMFDYSYYKGLTSLEAERASVVHNYTLSEELNYAFSTPNTKYREEIVPYVNYLRSTSLRANFTPLNAVDFGLRVSLSCEHPWSVRLQTDLRSVSRRRYYDDSMNDDEIIWNARLTKAFGERVQIQFEVSDILAQRKTVCHVLNAQSRAEFIFNGLRRFGMLHFIWSLGKALKTTPYMP